MVVFATGEMRGVVVFATGGYEGVVVFATGIYIIMPRLERFPFCCAG